MKKYLKFRLGIVLVLTSALIGISGCQIQGYRKGHQEANETYLKAHLNEMREALKKYGQEKGKPPQSLNDLVGAEYLSIVPTDPITGRIDWVPVYYNCEPSSNCITGLKDVHSASNETSSLGNRYSDW